jgi:hypothetical protein
MNNNNNAEEYTTWRIESRTDSPEWVPVPGIYRVRTRGEALAIALRADGQVRVVRERDGAAWVVAASLTHPDRNRVSL